MARPHLTRVLAPSIFAVGLMRIASKDIDVGHCIPPFAMANLCGSTHLPLRPYVVANMPSPMKEYSSLYLQASAVARG